MGQSVSDVTATSVQWNPNGFVIFESMPQIWISFHTIDVSKN